MPLIPLALALGGGAVVGFAAGKGSDGLGTVIKWTVIGTGVVIAGRAFKVF